METPQPETQIPIGLILSKYLAALRTRVIQYKLLGA